MFYSDLTVFYPKIATSLTARIVENKEERNMEYQPLRSKYKFVLLWHYAFVKSFFEKSVPSGQHPPKILYNSDATETRSNVIMILLLLGIYISTILAMFDQLKKYAMHLV